MYCIKCIHFLNIEHLLATAVSRSEYTAQMPATLETFHGSCIFIPCSFSTMESHVNSPATGVWRKGSQWFKDGVDVFNSSKSHNKLHGEILGDLTLWNCTSVLYGFTKDYEDKYFFRLESNVKLTFAEYVSIKVRGMKHLTPAKGFTLYLKCFECINNTCVHCEY